MKLYDRMMVNASKISFFWRVILCLIFPPLAVFDKGCFSVGLVYLLTLIGGGTGILFGLFFFSFLTAWIPAGLVALLICAADYNRKDVAEDDQPIIEEEEKVPMKLTFRDLLILGLRYLLCLIFPPLAVLDKGCGAALYVFLFTLAGWIPGVVLAFLICLKKNDYYAKPPETSEEDHE